MSVNAPARRSRELGFSLFEALVVLAIIGLVTAIVLVPVNSYWQRARLETTAGDIRNFLQQAYTEAVNQHTRIRVTLHDAAGVQTLTLTPAPLRSPATYTLPDFIRRVDANTNWPHPGDWELTCDTFGRTIDPTTNHQVFTTQTLAITHARMLDGSLTPNVRFDIQVFPIWNVTIRKTLV